MSYNSTGIENQMPIKDNMSLDTDHLRAVIGGISSRITPRNIATLINSLATAGINVSKVRNVVVGGSILSTDNIVTTDGTFTLVMPIPSDVFDSDNSESSVLTIAQKGAGTVTVAPSSTESFYSGDGSPDSSYILTSGVSVSFVTDGTDWIVISS